MKNLLLVTLSVTLGWASFAQSPYKTFNNHPASISKSRLATPRVAVDPAVAPSVNQVNAAQKSQSSPAQSFLLSETVIGTTTYDLQSNSAVANRIVYNSNGTVQTAWTYSNTYDLAAADRGTGYNFYDGTSFGPAPTDRIEGGTRTGWGELITLGNGTEVVIAHAPSLNNLVMSKRNPYGSGTWDVAPLSDIYPAALWPRVAAGGPDGNSIHVIAHDENTASLGGKLFYSRSLDGGTTWAAAIEVPGIDATNYAMIAGDSYAIHARGNYVAIVYFGSFERTVIAKSNDNGATWTSKQVFDLPFIYDYTSINSSGPTIGISDVNGDQIGDTIYTTDGIGTVIIDANGTAHLFWGVVRQLDDTLEAQGYYSNFPLVNGIGYWNENMRVINGIEEPQIIAGSLDMDGSGSTYDDHVILGGGIDFADYASGPTTMPNAGIDSNGCFYLVYTSAVETLNSGSQYYRHIYAIRSCDGGCTWSYPIELTNSDDYAFLECVFPSMAHTVGAKFHLLFQRDAEPGLAVRGDQDPFVLNDIVYIKEDAIRLDTVPFGCVGTIMLPYSTFCSGDSVLLTASCGTAWAWSTGATTQSIYVNSFGNVSCDITTNCGYIVTDDVTLIAPTTAPTVTVTASATTACPGDTVTISTNNISNATWTWSNSATTQSIVVNDTGTYSVTVQNCGGTTTKSVTINAPGAPSASITGAATVCSGDTVQLSANTGANLTYVWSTGGTTSTISVTATGTYSVTVSNCGGSSVASHTIATTALPTANITPFGPTTFCQGGSVALNASGAGTGGTYLWSSGQTTALATVSTAGSYTVTSYNTCGDSAVSAPLTVTVNPAPMVPGVLTFSSGSQWGFYCQQCDSIGTAQWNLNGSPMGGQTNDTLLVEWSTIGNGSITVTVTATGNGCSSTTTDVNVFVGMKEQVNSNSVSVYPNPNNGQFIVNFANTQNDKYTVSVKNILGQTVLNRTLNIEGNYKMFIDLSKFNAGMYFLTIANSQDEQIQKVIVK